MEGLSFETQMRIMCEFLCGYYVIESDGYITSSETDCQVFNVMEFEGNSDEIHYDDYHECYYMNDDSPMKFDSYMEDDVVCNDYFGDYYSDSGELSEKYKECDDYTVIWIHPVKSGSVTLDVNNFEICSDENSSYDTPSGYVVINHEVFPLEFRY